MNNKLVCVVFIVFYVASINCQYFSAPEGITIGRLGKRRSDQTNENTQLNGDILRTLSHLPANNRLNAQTGDESDLGQNEPLTSEEEFDEKLKQFYMNKLLLKLRNSQDKA